MITDNIPVFAAMARNRNSRSMNRGMIGYTLKEDFGPAPESEIRAYSDATCDDFAKYEFSSAPAPPFFFSRSLYPMFKKLITLKGLDMNLLRMVHGRQALICHAPVHRDDSISVEMSISGIDETPAGELLNIATRGYRKGSLVIEADTGFIVRKKSSGMEVSPPPAGKAEYREAEKKNGEIKLFIKTEKGQEKKYAKVSRDTNPIHTSNFFARIAGLPGRVMHGVCVIAMCSNALVDGLAGKDPERMRSVSGRFSYPVISGDTLLLSGERNTSAGMEEVFFDVKNSRGRSVIKNGYFSYFL